MISVNEQCVEKLKEIKCFLLDMDGTIYLGDTVIDGTHEFLDILKKQNKRAMYITNNSSKATSQYVEKLSRLGISSTEEDFFTSVNALEYNLKMKKNGAKLFVLGTPAFEEYLIGATVPNDKKVIVDEKIITAKGMGVSHELGLTIVALLCGKEKSDELRKSIIAD